MILPLFETCNLLFLLHNSLFFDIHEQKVADNCGHTEQGQPWSDVQNGVFQIEFSSAAFDGNYELK